METNKFLPFEEAREFARGLGLKSREEWKQYCKHDNMHNDIPKNPYKTYENKGWISWGDWLGNGIVSVCNIKFLPFEEAREFVRKLGLKSINEWNEYSKTENRPIGIPSNPNKIYKNKGWKSIGDWLGTKPGFDGNFLPFEEARKIVRKLGIKSIKEWTKSGKKPNNIPRNSDVFYKNEGWISWGDFFGTETIANFKKSYLLFEEAREFARGLGLKSREEWKQYCKSGKRPNNIPVTPSIVYKNEGWISWGDWFGTGRIANQNMEFLSFEEARELVKGLGLKLKTEWEKYCTSGNKPNNIPTDPSSVYKEQWTCWADFLGYIGNGNKWTKISLITYLEQIREYLHVCTVNQLMTIIESNGLYNYITQEKIKKIQDSTADSEERKKVTEEIIKDVKKIDEEEFEAIENTEEEITEVEASNLVNGEVDESKGQVDTTNNTELTEKRLKALDINAITASLDDERVQFLVQDMINSMWYDLLNHRLDITRISEMKFDTELPEKIKSDFFNECKAVVNLKMPQGWTYPFEPLLMQKLISYRLLQNKRYGNWSGVGAGKTVGAVLAGRYVGAKNTLVITFNSTIGKEDERGWTKEIRDSFKDSRIYTKVNKHVKFDNNYYNYLVLNYETFQQKGAANYVIDLLERNRIDYIILDEVQSVKQRTKMDESKRREVVFGLVNKVREINPDYYLLAMSATPVINNLTEAKSLIELISFTKLDDVKTKPNLSNCIELFRRLTNSGIRHKNIEDNILKENKYTIVKIDAPELYEYANRVSNDDVIAKELTTIDKKLEAITPYLNKSKGRTVIYTHYVDGIEDIIYNYLTNLGYNVGMYTGSCSKYNRESALTDFINGKYDILVGSRPMAIGVDGLQKIADRLIILSLPWTNAELEQLVGRINRKGSKFTLTGVDVIIPLVRMDGEKGSIRWDEYKYNTVTYKATIANAVVDGIIPDKIIVTRESLVNKAEDNLDEWINRLERGEILTIDREELKVELYPDITDEEERRRKINSELSEFNRIGKTTKSSTMNKRFNDDPESWHRYHTLRRESMKDWEEIPYVEIAKQITSENDKIIDFGCGDNQFKNYVKNQVTSVDHIAIDDTVIACDMADLSEYVEDESHDVAVFSLSLWGTNYPDYLKEAHRVLARKGMVYIAEPTKELEDPKAQDEFISLLNSIGFKLVGKIDVRNKFTYVTAIKI